MSDMRCRRKRLHGVIEWSYKTSLHPILKNGDFATKTRISTTFQSKKELLNQAGDGYSPPTIRGTSYHNVGIF